MMKCLATAGDELLDLMDERKNSVTAAVCVQCNGLLYKKKNPFVYWIT